MTAKSNPSTTRQRVGSKVSDTKGRALMCRILIDEAVAGVGVCACEGGLAELPTSLGRRACVGNGVRTLTKRNKLCLRVTVLYAFLTLADVPRETRLLTMCSITLECLSLCGTYCAIGYKLMRVRFVDSARLRDNITGK